MGVDKGANWSVGVEVEVGYRVDVGAGGRDVEHAKKKYAMNVPAMRVRFFLTLGSAACRRSQRPSISLRFSSSRSKRHGCGLRALICDAGDAEITLDLTIVAISQHRFGWLRCQIGLALEYSFPVQHVLFPGRFA